MSLWRDYTLGCEALATCTSIAARELVELSVCTNLSLSLAVQSCAKVLHLVAD